MKDPKLRNLTKRKDLMKLLKLSKAEVETLDKFIKLTEIGETKPSVFGKADEVMWTPAVMRATVDAGMIMDADVNGYLPDEFKAYFLGKFRASIKEMHRIIA